MSGGQGPTQKDGTTVKGVVGTGSRIPDPILPDPVRDGHPSVLPFPLLTRYVTHRTVCKTYVEGTGMRRPNAYPSGSDSPSPRVDFSYVRVWKD